MMNLLLFKLRISLLLVLTFLLCSVPIAQSSELVKDYILIIDVSGSMIGQGDGQGNIVFPDLKAATTDFITKKVPQGSTLHILPFGEKVFETKEFKLDSPGIRKQAVNYINGLKAIGKKTDLYGTTLDALGIAAQTTDRPVMLLIFTDGRDNVSRIPVSKVMSVYKRNKTDNPNLFVLCQYFSFSKDKSALPFPKEITTTRLNRDDANFGQMLNESLSSIDDKINEGLAKVKAEQEKLRKKKQELKQQEEKVAAELNELNNKKAALTQDEMARKEAFEKQQRELRQQAGAMRQASRLQMEQSKKQQEELDKNLATLSLQQEKFRGAQTMLAEADDILAQGKTVSDFMKARSLYKSVMKADNRNARAIQGIKDCDQKIDQLTPVYMKKMIWLYAFLAIAFLFLFNRLVYLDIIPNPFSFLNTSPMICSLSYSTEDDEGLPPTIRKVYFKKKDSVIHIGHNSGEIRLPLEAVTESHLLIKRRENKLFIIPQNGIVADSGNQNITGEKQIQSYAETFYLFRKDNIDNNAKLCIKLHVNS